MHNLELPAAPNSSAAIMRQLGAEDPGPTLAEAWIYFNGVHEQHAALKVKQKVQGLTPGERRKFKMLGTLCLSANHVVNALLDARTGEFSAPTPHVGYGA